MIHKSEPSALFLDSIHAAFHLAQGQGQGEVTVEDIWNHIVGLCLRKTPTFAEMFAWDVRCKPSSRRNRIADITTAIEQCYVPELRLGWKEKYGEIVIHIVTRLDQLDDQYVAEVSPTVTTLGSHYRGFRVLRLCEACKEDLVKGCGEEAKCFTK